MVDVTIERTFVAKLCDVPDDLQPIATVPLRLIQHIDVKDGGFTSSGHADAHQPYLGVPSTSYSCIC